MVRPAVLLVLIGCGSVDPRTSIDAAAPLPDAGDAGVPADVMPDAPMLPTGIVAWYRMDEPPKRRMEEPGFQVLDVTGAHDGRCDIAMCPSFTDTGQIGGSYLFDGVGQFWRVKSTPALQLTTGFTITAWINRTVMKGCILSKVFGTGDDNSWQICDRDDGGLFFFTSNGNPNSGDTQILAGPLAPGWHHVALWYDGATRTKRFYVDGRSSGAPSTDVTVAFDGGAFDGGAIVVGGDFNGAGQLEFPFGGQIDDLRIYNLALSEDEIRKLFDP